MEEKPVNPAVVSYVNKVRVCTACKHCKRVETTVWHGGWGRLWWKVPATSDVRYEWMCTHYRNPIDSNPAPVPCADARMSEMACGPRGVFFEPVERYAAHVTSGPAPEAA